MDETGPFSVSLSGLEEGETVHELSGSRNDLELGDDVKLRGPVVVRAHLFRMEQKIEVQGELMADLDLTCDRCLGPVPTRLRVPVRVFADRRSNPGSGEEIDEDEVGIVYHDGQYLDLTEEVRQTLLVEAPWHVLCGEDCRGLCPRCGTNLNRQSCSCLDSSTDDRWNALRRLRDQGG